MGFYGAKGPAGAIPHLYSNLAAQFLKESFAHSKRISYMEYYKPNWTYHAKGITFHHLLRQLLNGWVNPNYHIL